MKLSVRQVDTKTWNQMSEQSHLICFNEKRERSLERIDYALLVIGEETDLPMGYITVRECDGETVYWQHGGGFPGTIGIPIFRTYEACIAWTKNRYKRIYTQIENKNKRMLKMAMKVGFEIIGVKSFHQHVMLEHLLEF